jgi:hypothetical protein
VLPQTVQEAGQARLNHKKSLDNDGYKEKGCQALVTHACNPSYSGGRDQENRGLKPPGEIVSETLSRKTCHKNRAGGVAQGVSPEFKP